MAALWIASIVWFCIALFVTAQGGFEWGVWAWVALAVPLWLVTSWGRWRAMVLGFLPTAAVTVGIPFAMRWLDARRADVPDSLSIAGVALLLAWPVVFSSFAAWQARHAWRNEPRRS